MIETEKPVPPPGSLLHPIRLIGYIPRACGAKGTQVWDCRCQCGQITAVNRTSLIRGVTKSCGCIRRAHARKTLEAARVTQAKKRKNDAV
jgi:hypothetical protein